MARGKSNHKAQRKTSMKIMIVGSMTSAKEMLETKKKLESLGHFVSVPTDTEIHLKDPNFINDFKSNIEYARENDILRKCFNLIAGSDAILVLNHKKNNVGGYIGTSVLMEIGLAYYLGKKIFLLNSIPSPHDVRWAHEIEMIQPAVINGDLCKIK